MKLLLKILVHRKAIGAALDLLDVVEHSSKDGKITDKERSELMSAMWRVIDAYKAAK
tara:strand:+ start:3515 stop:3685 length:171 start_codon:yes stop_codon:yes gene_type:complete